MTRVTSAATRFWSDFWEHLIFLVILIGLLPGIHDYSLFFLDLGSHIPQTGGSLYERLFVNNDFLFLLAFLVLPGVLFLIFRRKKWSHLIGLLPYLVYGLAYLGVYVICLGSPKDWELAITLACFVSFVYFIVRGTLFSWSFLLFLVLVWIGLSALQMALFAGFALAFRFLFLLFSQNWETFQELGPGRLISAFFRSFLLWSPMLLVVLFSWWSNKFIQEQATEALYANSFLKHQPEFLDSAQLDSIQLMRSSFKSWEKELENKTQNDTTRLYNKRNASRLSKIRDYERLKARLTSRNPRLRGAYANIATQIEKGIQAEKRAMTGIPLSQLRSRYEPIWQGFASGKNLNPNQELRLRRELKVHLKTRPANSAIEQDCWDYQAPKQKAFRLLALRSPKFERDLHISLCDTVEMMKLAALKQIDSLENSVENIQEELPPAAGDLVRNSLGAARVKPGNIDLECRWYRADCKIGEGAANLATKASAEATEASLQEAGNKMANDLQKQVQSLGRQCRR